MVQSLRTRELLGQIIHFRRDALSCMDKSCVQGDELFVTKRPEPAVTVATDVVLRSSQVRGRQDVVRRRHREDRG